MYFSVFQSSQYNTDEEDKINNIKQITETEDNCIICWSPQDNYNKLYLLTEIPNISLDCCCQPKLHEVCLNNWLKNTCSCPICRKKILVNIQLRMRLKISSCIGHYIQCLFKIYFCILGLQLLFIFVDKVIIIHDEDIKPQE